MVKAFKVKDKPKNKASMLYVVKISVKFVLFIFRSEQKKGYTSNRGSEGQKNS